MKTENCYVMIKNYMKKGGRRCTSMHAQRIYLHIVCLIMAYHFAILSFVMQKKRSIHGPYDKNQYTRFVELYLVNDYRTVSIHLSLIIKLNVNVKMSQGAFALWVIRVERLQKCIFQHRNNFILCCISDWLGLRLKID